MSSQGKPNQPIAIVGVGAIFPHANNPVDFWTNIIQGKDLVSDVLPSHWLIQDYYDPNPAAKDKTYCKRGAFLNDIAFDPIEFGIPPSVIPATDSSQLLALLVAKQVLDEATAGTYAECDLSRVSVILGGSALEALQYAAARMQRPVWEKVLYENGFSTELTNKICEGISNNYTDWQENTFPGLLGNVVAGRIANRFNLGGTNCITDAACAGSLAALSMAVNELQMGQADMVLTGGIDTLNDIVMYMCFSKTGALSLTGDCRPFSEQADGTILGEGLGMFALKRLSDAEQQGDAIYAVIKGIGTSSDGRAKSIYAPLAKGQKNAICRAYEAAGFTADTVELIEAHGTGTKAGDVAEFEGLTMAFRAHDVQKQHFCALGSVKSQIGHTKSAAGAAGLFKAVMALRHKVFPPTIKVDAPNSKLELEKSPFYINTQLRPWIRKGKTPRRAGVSAFGFGGSNFHIAVEEYQGPAPLAGRLRSSSTELFTFSAEDVKSLLAQLTDYKKDLQDTEINLPQFACHLQSANHSHHLARLAIVASSLNDLLEKITIAQLNIKETESFTDPKGIYFAYAKDGGKVAFMFPGQGSQYLNMGADIISEFSSSMSIWEQFADFPIKSNKSLDEIVFPKPTFTPEAQAENTAQLQATQYTQPALAVTSLLYLQLLAKLGIQADCTFGHSFGELVALHAAGAYSAEQLMEMAAKRGDLMQSVAHQNPGAMLSIHASTQEVLEIIKNHSLAVTPANFNGPKQLIVAGSVSAIEQAERTFTQFNIKTIRLPVATAFHSQTVAAASQPYYDYLRRLKFSPLKMDVWSNLTAGLYASDKIAENLSRQISNPVLFENMVRRSYASGIKTFIEVGPHQVLTGLVKQILEDDPDVQVIALDRKGQHGLTHFWHSLAKLFVGGLNPQFASLWEEYSFNDAMQKNKPKFTLSINGTNYGKPYPSKSNQESTNRSDQVVVKPMLKQKIEEIESPVKLTKPLKQAREEELMSDMQNNQVLIQIYQDMQNQLLAAHNAHQAAMCNSHVAFLHSMTQLSHQFLQGSVGGNNMLTMPAFSPSFVPMSMPMMPQMMMSATAQPQATAAANFSPAPAPVAPTMVAPPAMAPTAPVMHAAPIQAAAPIPQFQVPPAPAAVAPAPQFQSVAPATFNTQTAARQDSIIVSPPIAEVKAAPVSKGPDLRSMLLDVVVEKTGYPLEMLNMEMSIEADLGIDSIKRVEILSHLSEKLPHLPEISPQDLAELHTLGDIVNHLQRFSAGVGAHA